MKLNPQKTALAVGAFAGLWHFVWGLLVAFGLASVILNLIYGLHFLNNPFIVQPFNIIRWIILVVVTAIMGYIFGYVFAVVWNKVNR